MKINYAQNFSKYGCNFSGNLAIVEYSQRMHDIALSQPLGGFGRGACFDALNEAQNLINEKHPQHEILLSIPALVVKI